MDCRQISVHLLTPSLVDVMHSVLLTRCALLHRSPASAESKSRTQRRNHDRAATKAYKGGMIAEDW